MRLSPQAMGTSFVSSGIQIQELSWGTELGMNWRYWEFCEG
jgi:hypothetical protein